MIIYKASKNRASFAVGPRCANNDRECVWQRYFIEQATAIKTCETDFEYFRTKIKWLNGESQYFVYPANPDAYWYRIDEIEVEE